ncbi:MAG: hypothetical protein M1825_000313 [Sarcosagium campestre]|nr:MAG: hypothetical protein M1825_000313 [Sarcosagium campestre]
MSDYSSMPAGRSIRQRSPGSTISDVDFDQEERLASFNDSPPRRGEPDPRNSLQHVLANDTTSAATTTTHYGRAVSDAARTPIKLTWTHEHTRDTTEEAEDETAALGSPDPTRTPNAAKSLTPSGSTNRRGVHTGATSSVYGGNKMKNIKKEDGIPLWRKDIQYDFLRAVFDDEKPVFTSRADGSKGHTFADIYVDAMARSTKTSKILRDKLWSDRAAAANMAMVCLLVNVGRMNTTLNFFPEMRAQLRTYHAIPCLQARQDPNSYKQLQDAPRLKSILKGASEDRREPTNLEKIRDLAVPRTNPVNLIFVLSQYAPKLTDLHFSPQLDFFDLIQRTTLSSRSRAKGFLWLMWWYLESDFSPESAANNPFGAGQPPLVDGVPQKIPSFEHLTEEQAARENVDTEEEIAYGNAKQEERRRINEHDPAMSAPSQKRSKTKVPLRASGNGRSEQARSKTQSRPMRHSTRDKPRNYSDFGLNLSDTDRTRSVSPPGHRPTFNINAPRSSLAMTGNSDLDDSRASPAIEGPQKVGRGRWPRNKTDRAPRQRLILKTKGARSKTSPAPPGRDHPVLRTEGSGARKQRPLTAHQIAVERNRQQRVDYLLDRRLRRIFSRRRRARKQEGAVWRAWKRNEALIDPFYDTDCDLTWNAESSKPFIESGPAGLIALESEEEDYGEEIGAYTAAVRRTGRRLFRWDQLEAGVGGVMATDRGAKRAVVPRTAADDDLDVDGDDHPRGSSGGPEEGDEVEEVDDAEAEAAGVKEENAEAALAEAEAEAEAEEDAELDEREKERQQELLNEDQPSDDEEGEELDEGPEDESHMLPADDDTEEELDEMDIDG